MTARDVVTALEQLARGTGMVVGFVTAVLVLLPVALVFLVDAVMRRCGRWLVGEREG